VKDGNGPIAAAEDELMAAARQGSHRSRRLKKVAGALIGN
jgi:hypothetical protein